MSSPSPTRSTWVTPADIASRFLWLIIARLGRAGGARGVGEERDVAWPASGRAARGTGRDPARRARGPAASTDSRLASRGSSLVSSPRMSSTIMRSTRGSAARTARTLSACSWSSARTKRASLCSRTRCTVLGQAVDVEAERHAARGLHRELGVEPGRAVAGDHRDAVAALEPERHEAQAHRAHVGGVVGPGDLLPDPVALLAERDVPRRGAPPGRRARAGACRGRAAGHALRRPGSPRRGRP